MEAFAIERHKVYLCRSTGKSFPWTDDPILQKYKFNNIYRELDKTTIWIKENIRDPFADHKYLWFMIVLARHFNRPNSLMFSIDNYWPISDKWSPSICLRKLQKFSATGNPVLNPNAYQVYSENVNGTSKLEYIINNTIKNLWKDRANLTAAFENAKTCHEVFELLSSYPGLGSFIPAQIIYDAVYTHYLSNASDRDDWAGCGRGSTRGLNSVFGRDPEFRVYGFHIHEDHDSHIQEMNILRKKLSWPKGWPKLTLRDIENILCEYGKLVRVKSGGHLTSYTH